MDEQTQTMTTYAKYLASIVSPGYCKNHADTPAFNAGLCYKCHRYKERQLKLLSLLSGTNIQDFDAKLARQISSFKNASDYAKSVNITRQAAHLQVERLKSLGYKITFTQVEPPAKPVRFCTHHPSIVSVRDGLCAKCSQSRTKEVCDEIHPGKKKVGRGLCHTCFRSIQRRGLDCINHPGVSATYDGLCAKCLLPRTKEICDEIHPDRRKTGNGLCKVCLARELRLRGKPYSPSAR